MRWILPTLFACSEATELATSTPAPGPDVSYFGADVSDYGTGESMITATRSDGEPVLLVLATKRGVRTDENGGQLYRFDPTTDGLEHTLLAETEGWYYNDLGVLDALQLGHSRAVVYGLGQAWDLDDGVPVPYEVHPDSEGASPIPCGDVDGDGIADRCHGRAIRLASGDDITLTNGVIGFTAGPPVALSTGHCRLFEPTVGHYERDQLDCSTPGPRTNSVRARDVDGNGSDDFVLGDQIVDWSGRVVASIPPGAGGDFADLDGDGILDLAQRRDPDEDHDRRWLAFYRGPLEGDLTPDAEWENPCHVDPLQWQSFANQLEFIDVDRDGVQDVVVTDSTCDRGRVFVNTDPFGP
jgi:hypothetical protein